MRLTIAMAAMLAAAGCATASQDVKLHDPDMTKSLEEFFRGGFAAMDAGDIEYWKKNACPEAVMWDIGTDGAPINASGKAEVDKALDGFQQAMQSGMKIQTNIISMQCRSSTLSGHCLVVFDQTMTKDGQTMGPFKFRGTAIGERIGDHWIWSHWHGSMREAPPADASASATAGDEVSAADAE